MAKAKTTKSNSSKPKTVTKKIDKKTSKQVKTAKAAKATPKVSKVKKEVPLKVKGKLAAKVKKPVKVESSKSAISKKIDSKSKTEVKKISKVLKPITKNSALSKKEVPKKAPLSKQEAKSSLLGKVKAVLSQSKSKPLNSKTEVKEKVKEQDVSKPTSIKPAPAKPSTIKTDSPSASKSDTLKKSDDKKGSAQAPVGKVKAEGKKLDSKTSRKLSLRETRSLLICRELTCEENAISEGYCRLHYIKNWFRIKRKKQILEEGRLEDMIQELVDKFPEKTMDAVRNDLFNDGEFNKIVSDLELDLDDVSTDEDDEENEVESLIGGYKDRDDVDDF